MHDRFEALSGALALGEATPAERALFEVHAAGCAACRDDARAFLSLLPMIARARAEETWHPDRRQAVFARIGARRERRTLMTVRALAWAVGASLALNAAIATGVGSYVGRAFAASRAEHAAGPGLKSLERTRILEPHARSRP